MNKREQRIEVFCNELFKTNNQRKAYRAAYPSAVKWKDATVDSKASVMAKDEKVLARLQEMRKIAAEESKITRGDLLEQLGRIAFADIDSSVFRPEHKIKALELMAKMLGMDKPEEGTKTDDRVVGVVMLPEIKED